MLNANIARVNFSPWPFFDEDEIEAVTKVLVSGKVNYWTGNEVKSFEKEFADYIETKHAIALANGTVALEAALKAINILPGDEVIVPSRTFLATASSVVMQGATPVIADIDLNSQNITADTIEKVLTDKTKAIIVVHLAGFPCEMDPILALAKQHKLWVIEDCAQAHGATYKGKKVGSMGHIGAFSFCQDKIMTTAGEGGMVTTNDTELWEKMWSFKDHGKNFNKIQDKTQQSSFRWVHDSFGTNWRMTEVQAAIGRLQLKKLPHWLELRANNAEVLAQCIRNISLLRLPSIPSHMKHAYYKFYAFINNEMLLAGWNKDRILNEINQLGVPCFFGSCSEIYLEKAFIALGDYQNKRLANAQKLGEVSLMFQVHPTLSINEMQMKAEVIQKICTSASKNKNDN